MAESGVQPMRPAESARPCQGLWALAEARGQLALRLQALLALSLRETPDRTVPPLSVVRQARLAAFRHPGGPLSQAAPDKQGIPVKAAAAGAETTMASELPVALAGAAAGVAPVAGAEEQAWRSPS
jgi:hypothetical protein